MGQKQNKNMSILCCLTILQINKQFNRQFYNVQIVMIFLIDINQKLLMVDGRLFLKIIIFLLEISSNNYISKRLQIEDQYNENIILIELMEEKIKKKIDLTTVLDELRSQDSKKRLHSIQMLKDLATAMGPLRVRNQLISFLNQFIDDEENIIQALCNQLNDFSPLLGGAQHEKVLLPLMISFCRNDSKEVANAAMKIMLPILDRNPSCLLDTLKKLLKNQMYISRDCVNILIVELINKNSTIEDQLIEIYNGSVTSNNPSIRKCAAKYLNVLYKNITKKEQIEKMIQILVNDSDDLPKMLCINVIIDFYQFNPNFALIKLKNILSLSSWRINLHFCQNLEAIYSKINKTHCRAIIQPFFIKFFSSSEPEVRAASCKGLVGFTKSLQENQFSTKLIPNLKLLANDQILYVKIVFAQNILSLCELIPKSLVNDFIVPIATDYIKSQNFELCFAILKNFQLLSAYISETIFQNKILKQIQSYFSSDNWRLKCQVIDCLQKIFLKPQFLRQKAIATILELVFDRVDAVRKKVILLIASIMKNHPHQWSQSNIFPSILKFKDHSNYLYRQTLILIIQKTINSVSEKTLNNVYKGIIKAYLNDKTSNLLIITLNIIKDNPAIMKNDRWFQERLNNLKDDKDIQVKGLAKTLLIKC